MNKAEFDAQVRPQLDAWIATRPRHEAAYLTQLFDQESGYTPYAESGTGAVGLGQITRGTWADIATFAARNIPAEELPSDLSYADLQRSDAFELYAKRPFANAFMTWATIKRLESFALDTINDKRIAAGENVEAAGSLLNALGEDPRRWAMVVGAGHKDGMGRMTLFSDDSGRFSTEPARKFYRERRARYQERARNQAKAAEQLDAQGNPEQAAVARRRARALAQSDSTGHVFGFGDRLASAVAEATGQPPLEFTPEEYRDFYELRAPGHSETNPAVARFTQALATLPREPGVSEPTAPFPETEPEESSLLTQVRDFLFPPANAGTESPQTAEEVAASPRPTVLPEELAPLFDGFTTLPQSRADAQAEAEAAAAQAQAGVDPADFNDGLSQDVLQGIPSFPPALPPEDQSRLAVGQTAPGDPTGSALDPEARNAAIDALINASIDNSLGNVPEGQFNARTDRLQTLRDTAAQSLRGQNLSAIAASLNQPVDLGSDDSLLASLESGGPSVAGAGEALRGLTGAASPTQVSASQIGAIGNFINNDTFGGFQTEAARDVLSNLSPTEALQIQNIPLPFGTYADNDALLRESRSLAERRLLEQRQLDEVFGIEQTRLGFEAQTQRFSAIQETLERSIRTARNNAGL